MKLIVLGDKSRYQFLRKIITDENINLKTEILSEKNIEIMSDIVNNIDNPKERVLYFSKKLPLHTTLFFPSEINTDSRYEINNKILFFDEFPYRTATGIENIKHILEKNPKLDFEIILIKNNRKNLESDLSNENEAIKIAIREYNLERFRVKVVDFEENYNFLFWSFEGFKKNTNSFTNDLEELKKNLDIFFEIEYEMEYIQIEEKLSEQLLDSFVKYKKSFINKDNIMDLLKIDVSDYFFKNDYNYKKFFEFSENLYLKNIDKVCVWNAERDLKNLKLKFKKRIEEFIELPILIKFDGIAEEDYIFFYNKYKKEMIEFKNRIKIFFKTELCQLIKDYIKNKIERMENFLDEKIY